MTTYLEPAAVAARRRYLVGAVLGDDVAHDFAREADHAREEPRRGLAAVEWELREPATPG